MTVSDLIDYLGQFPPKTRVVLSEDDARDEEDYIVLETLNFEIPSAIWDGKCVAGGTYEQGS